MMKKERQILPGDLVHRPWLRRLRGGLSAGAYLVLGYKFGREGVTIDLLGPGPELVEWTLGPDMLAKVSDDD